MAVKTKIAPEKLQEMCAPFGVGRVTAAEGIGRGNVQTNYAIETEKGRFVLRLYENRTREQVEFEMDVLSRLAAAGFPCPRPACAYPYCIGEYAGKPYALFTFLEGAHAQEWNTERRKSAARAAARMALALEGFVPVNMHCRWNYGAELCAKLAREYAGKYEKTEKLGWYLSALSALEFPENMPMGVCHADWDLGNMFFEGDDLSALLDFDDANYTFAAYDIAAQADVFRADFRWDTWQDFAPGDDVIDLEGVRLVAGAYQEIRPLREIEKEHLFDLFKLSVLIDCLWFFARGDGDFYEKRKIDALDRYGRERFRRDVFGE